MKKVLFLVLLIFSLLGGAISLLAANDTNSKEKLHILLFYSRHCGACMKVENEILPPILKKYGDKIDLVQKEISEKGVMEELALYNSRSSVPTMVVGGKIFIGSDEIAENLEKIIKEFIAGELAVNSVAPPTDNKKKQ